MRIVNYTGAPDDVQESLENPILGYDDLLPSREEFVRKTKKEKNYYSNNLSST